jgi:hypothetical protein
MPLLLPILHCANRADHPTHALSSLNTSEVENADKTRLCLHDS